MSVGIDATVPWWHGWWWGRGSRSRDGYRDGPAVVSLIGIDFGGGCSVGSGWMDGVDGRWRWGRTVLSVQPQVFVLLAEPVQLHFKLLNAPPLSFQKLLLALDDVVKLQQVLHCPIRALWAALPSIHADGHLRDSHRQLGQASGFTQKEEALPPTWSRWGGETEMCWELELSYQSKMVNGFNLRFPKVKFSFGSHSTGTR